GAEPSIYSQAEIAAMILSGDSGASRVSERSLDSHVVGALSGIVVGKLRSRIAPHLPIDVLKVDVERGAGREEARLEAGTYLTEALYVSYVHQFSVLGGAR